MNAPSASPRIDRRRARTRAAILQAAARLLAAGDATLDDIADAADVARATLYTHFVSKNELVAAICRPTLERATSAVAAIHTKDARAAVSALVAVYADLWSADADAMRVAARTTEVPDAEYGALHATFMREVLRVFGAAERAGVLRAGSAQTAAMILRKIAVPLLEACAQAPDGHTAGRRRQTGDPASAFRASLEGALLGDVRRTRNV